MIVESQFLAAQILVGLGAEEEGKDDEDGEGKAVYQTHPQPDAHPEFEPSGHLGIKWIKVWTIILKHGKCEHLQILPITSKLEQGPILGWLDWYCGSK